ncbi:MAG: L-threonylcarbamoyladenylate synthase [Rhodothermia bacterium]|nr:MAG: L-threonylcarbamoyladenylate synthase [Rhodothermia bacterium]
MRTVITEDIHVAARFIRQGSLVAFPTETVYGLGADATNKAAIRAIFKTKGRPANNPIIVHIADFRELTGVAESVSAPAMVLMDAFFPGPLTLILDRHPAIPEVVSAGLSTVGVRMPDHEQAVELIRTVGRPIAAPSANLSGRPSPTTWQAVKEDLEGQIACILRGEQTPIGLESTVVDCTREAPVILRSGNVTLEQLRQVIPEITQAVEEAVGEAHSPGILHRHYAPRASVFLVDQIDEVVNAERAGFIGLSAPHAPAEFLLVEQISSLEDYAYRLFEFYRECDRLGAESIFCERVAQEGVGVALMDRLERAARR